VDEKRREKREEKEGKRRHGERCLPSTRIESMSISDSLASG
jgi:hypothetical protein